VALNVKFDPKTYKKAVLWQKNRAMLGY